MQYRHANPAAPCALTAPVLQQELAAAFLVQLPQVRQTLAAASPHGGLRLRDALLLLRSSALHLCTPAVTTLCVQLDEALEQVRLGLSLQDRQLLLHDLLVTLQGLERGLYGLMA